MLLRNQNAIDKFDANFRTDADGQIIFQPPGSTYGAPVSAEEYDAVLAAFDRRHAFAMAFMWLAVGTAVIYGGYRSIFKEDDAFFFGALAIAFVLSTALSAIGYASLLWPFAARRDALRAASGSQEGHP